MRAVLTDEYIKDNYKLYRTIPHGVALPHREPDPKKLKRFITQKRKAGMIVPQQQVQSISLEAINALSTGGQAEKIRQTASMLYLGIQKELFGKQQQIETKLPPKKVEEMTDKRKMIEKMMDEQLLNMEVLYDPDELQDMTYNEKVELLKQLNVYDEVMKFAKQKTRETQVQFAKEGLEILEEKEELESKFEKAEKELQRVSGY